MVLFDVNLAIVQKTSFTQKVVNYNIYKFRVDWGIDNEKFSSSYSSAESR